ncbi:MAG TPA: tRNA (N(6)-L-threonylcarbamoyladenosine(37)-C(2))-methylthiotransferase MtaB [Anaerolineaceae bacterium]|jgi:threonylcarbamoyladenosine tRNA methylthiotransferase MtaB|nr:tRNA (N(6)-L-threonylcarbamoyladenosine(37)-C(2))-methylthiotransferase MtaB [Anaerolineaceae bacterium]
MKIFLDMVGCRLNQSEIERLARDFIARGEEVVSDPAAADTIIVNTCCVTAKACADSRKTIRRYQRETSANVIATGCYVTAFETQAVFLLGEQAAIPNSQKDALPLLVTRRSQPGPSALQTAKPELGPRSRTRSFLKVQDGCDNFCTYCLTRIARGRSRSLPLEEILRDAQLAEAAGTKEIVLTGVQIGSWGKDLAGGELRIAQLVESLLQNTSIPRIRISSIEPWDVDEALLACFERPRLCPHLHLPLQSGSENTLKRMARPFSAADFRDLMRKVHADVPDLSVTTDILCGFPGEDETAFAESCAFVEEMDFSGGHVFPFSPMPGTAAARLTDKVQEKLIRERSEILRKILQAKAAEKQKGKVGAWEEILWEHGRNDVYSGFTRDYFRVQTESAIDLSNTITCAKISGVSGAGVLTAGEPTGAPRCDNPWSAPGSMPENGMQFA